MGGQAVTETEGGEVRLRSCKHPRMIKAGQRNNANDYCPDCGWFDDWREDEINSQKRRFRFRRAGFWMDVIIIALVVVLVGMWL